MPKVRFGNYMAIKEVVNCLRRMTTMEDPLSKTSKERAEHSRPDAYVNASYEEMEVAYGIMKKEAKTRLQSDLVDFLCDIWAYANAYKESGELWRMFGDMLEGFQSSFRGLLAGFLEDLYSFQVACF